MIHSKIPQRRSAVHTIVTQTRFFEVVVHWIILHIRTYYEKATSALHRPAGPEGLFMTHATYIFMTHATYKGISLATLPQAAAIIGILLAGGCARSPDARALDDTATRLHLAQLAEAEGNAKEELALLAPAAARNPGNIALQTRYATALAQTGHNQQALDVA